MNHPNKRPREQDIFDDVQLRKRCRFDFENRLDLMEMMLLDIPLWEQVAEVTSFLSLIQVFPGLKKEFVESFGDTFNGYDFTFEAMGADIRQTDDEVTVGGYENCMAVLSVFGSKIHHMYIEYMGFTPDQRAALNGMIGRTAAPYLRTIKFGAIFSTTETLSTELTQFQFPQVNRVEFLFCDLDTNWHSCRWIFPNLNRLHLRNVRLRDFNVDFENLEVLKIAGDQVNYTIEDAAPLWRNAQQLFQFDWTVQGEIIQFADVVRLFRNNSALRSLRVHTHIDEFVSIRPFLRLARQHPSLEFIDVWCPLTIPAVTFCFKTHKSVREIRWISFATVESITEQFENEHMNMKERYRIVKYRASEARCIKRY